MPKDHDYIESSLVSAQALLGVINQILEYSKISAVGPQQFELAREPFTLGGIAEDLADIISMKADRGKVVVILDVDASLRSRGFVGDAFRLRQCLINLVSACVLRFLWTPCKGCGGGRRLARPQSRMPAVPCLSRAPF